MELFLKVKKNFEIFKLVWHFMDFNLFGILLTQHFEVT